MAERSNEAWGELVRECDTVREEVDFYRAREKSICAAVGGISDGGRYRNDVIEHLQLVFARAETATALRAALEKAFAADCPNVGGVCYEECPDWHAQARAALAKGN